MKVLLAVAALAGPAAAEGIIAADLALPTSRYDHAVLGDALEWGALDLRLSDGQRLRLTLPETRVFEDVEVRLADLDGDGRAEVVVVETDMARGAMLAIYDETGRVAATRPPGETHRWLAPAGIGDLDGDGRVEIAYVDRPHLLRELVVVRLDGTRLTELARIPGLTNHRIGEPVIRGGLRDCGAGPELVLADADWSGAVAVTLGGAGLAARPLGPISGSADLDRLRDACP